MQSMPSVQPGQAASTGVHRYGLIKAKIGSCHMVRGPKGTLQQLQVHDASRYPEAVKVVRCLTCRETYKTVEEMKAAHPTHQEMVKANEKHSWCWWTDEQMEVRAPDGTPQLDANGKQRMMPVGLLSDEEFAL